MLVCLPDGAFTHGLAGSSSCMDASNAWRKSSSSSTVNCFLFLRREGDVSGGMSPLAMAATNSWRLR
ncbi:hypothetical protein NP493_690g01011 [Ridgeia piscesae]|uniref:Uncharacterized protein n=1 Tax=Ridgeia piscesae TaxID=27915 RepID=A0AAD9NQS7_RIDPI|nr:hypothetical protein NP493_690g01011 [Ridgeia piscesae]